MGSSEAQFSELYTENCKQQAEMDAMERKIVIKVSSIPLIPLHVCSRTTSLDKQFTLAFEPLLFTIWLLLFWMLVQPNCRKSYDEAI